MVVKLELLGVGFGSPRFINTPVSFGPSGGTAVTRDVRIGDGILRVGVNYRFY
jgi:hypothetical protein